MIISMILSWRTDRKVLAFVIIGFVFAHQVLTQIAWNVDIPGLPFDLGPNRLVLFVLSLVLVGSIVAGISKPRVKNGERIPLFLILLYIFGIIISASAVYNYKRGRIQGNTLILIPSDVVLFILMYHVMKLKTTPSVLEALLKAIMMLSLFMSALGVYQFLFDSSFLKVCAPRHAFARFIRSTGVLGSEYELGFFLNFAIIVCLTRYWGKPMLFMTLPVLITGLFTTFHRLNWVIFIVCLLCYVFIKKGIKGVGIWAFVFVMLAGLISMGYFTNGDWYKTLADSKNVQAFSKQRLLEDTVSGRLHQFAITADGISFRGLGLGSYENKAYYNLMAKHGFIKTDGEPLIVHNGYLGVGIKHGGLAMAVFCAFICSMLIYFKKRICLEKPLTVCPFFIALIWIIANMSQEITLFGLYFVLLVAIICGSFVSLYDQAGKPVDPEGPEL